MVNVVLGQEVKLPSTRWTERYTIKGVKYLGSDYFFVSPQQAEENEKLMRKWDYDEEDSLTESGWYVDDQDQDEFQKVEQI